MSALTEALDHSLELLDGVLSVEQYQQAAKKLGNEPSGGMRLVRDMMMAIGAVIAVVGIELAVLGVGLPMGAAIFAGGVTLSALSATFFYCNRPSVVEQSAEPIVCERHLPDSRGQL